MKYEKGTFTTVPNMSALKGKNAILQVIYMWLCFHADKKGTCFPSQTTIANACGIGITSLNKFMKELEDLNLLKREIRNIKGSKEKDTTIYHIGTSCGEVGTSCGEGEVLRQAKEGTSSGEERTKPNELKPIKLKESDFDLFYSAYPIHTSKLAAQKAFAKVKVDVQVLIKAIEVQKKDRKKKEESGVWLPRWKGPAPWLNQGCWEDEIEVIEISTEESEKQEFIKLGMSRYFIKHGNEKTEEMINKYGIQ